MSSFRSRRKGRVHVQLPAMSATLIADLARQLVELLSDGEPLGDPSDPLAELDSLDSLESLDSPREPPTDPALRRLLPDAYRDDAEGAGEFRRFTERSLRSAKVEAARTVIDTIGELGDVDAGEAADDDGGDVGSADETTVEFELTADQARAWMRCLTDLRLTLAERLGVTADDDEADWLALPDGDPKGSLYRIYGWLGYQLETLIEAVEH